MNFEETEQSQLCKEETAGNNKYSFVSGGISQPVRTDNVDQGSGGAFSHVEYKLKIGSQPLEKPGFLKRFLMGGTPLTGNPLASQLSPKPQSRVRAESDLSTP